MRRDQLEHAIRAAATLVKLDTVIVIGSQSVLGTWTEDELPPEATMSREVDILPLALSHGETEALAEQLGSLGELTPFDQKYGFHIDGVDESTAVLPEGWMDRLVEVRAYSALLGRDVTGLCLEPHDLCIAKLVANREKDRRFVGALLDADLIDQELLLERLSMTSPPEEVSLDPAFGWLLDRVTPPTASPRLPEQLSQDPWQGNWPKVQDGTESNGPDIGRGFSI